jgi:hypothetical protein
MPNHKIEPGKMDQPVAMGAGYTGIYLSNNFSAVVDGRQSNVHRYPEGTIAMDIRRGNLYDGHIQRQKAPLEKFGNLTEKNRNIFCITLFYGISYGGRREHRVHPESLTVGGLCEFDFAQNGNTNQLYRLQIAVAGCQGLEQISRRMGAAVHINSGPGSDTSEGFFGRNINRFFHGFFEVDGD